MSRKQIIQILATREAGYVRRAHAGRNDGTYTIASHSYGALNLCLLLHPNPSLDLIRAIMWHDVAERWLGDLPSPGKSGALGEGYETLEKKLLQELDLCPQLIPADADWLRAVDLFDLYLWCLEEKTRGNGFLREWIENCDEAFLRLDREGRLPVPVRDAYLDLKRYGAHGFPRLSDFPAKVLREMRAPDRAPL